MARKELSPYAPDRWIREMNRRYPNLWAELRKGYVDTGKNLRLKSGAMELLGSVPDWCIMPALFPFLVMTDKYGEHFYLTHMDELMTMGSTYIWRCSKGVYRFAPEIYQALVRQPLSGNLPQECLYPSTMDSAPKKAIMIASNNSSCGIRFIISPAHSRIKAFGQYHHLVRLPMPSAGSPASEAQTPLRKTW